MRDALNNPFQPGSDIVPAVWGGRSEQLADWRDVLRPRLSAGLFERGRTFLGEPGLGKSSLVRRIAADARTHGDWVSGQIRIAAGTDPLKRLATEALELASTAGLAAAQEHTLGQLLARVQEIAVHGVSVSLRESAGAEAHVALTELLVEIGRAALKADHVVLIHIDEVQNIGDEDVLSQLLIALGDAITHAEVVEVPGSGAVERSLPIAVYLTGLPEFDASASTRSGATFTRRFATTVLEPLSDDDLLEALQPFVISGWRVAGDAGEFERVRMQPAAAAAIVDLSKGEPFLFQLAGERAWYAGTGGLITEEDVRRGWQGAIGEATSHVERILNRLPPREKEFLSAMADLPQEERTFSRIASAAGFANVTAAGPASQRLDRVRGIIARGKRYRFRHRAVEAFLTSDWPDPEASS